MLEPQALDDLERNVAIVELKTTTAEAAYHPDEATLSSAARLAKTIEHTLLAERPTEKSLAVPLLFSLKIRVSAALDRLGRLRVARSNRK